MSFGLWETALVIPNPNEVCSGIPTGLPSAKSKWFSFAHPLGGVTDMGDANPSYFHIHLVSDSTGETLTTIAKAAAVRYSHARPIEHVQPLVRTARQMERCINEIEASPGLVLYTLVDDALRATLEDRCQVLNVPCVDVLAPVLSTFDSYLGAPSQPAVGAQHVLDNEYFKRIDALNFTLVHDDGNLPANLDDADIVILGISRTSKTPTSIYLANRGFKTANIPLVPELPLPDVFNRPTTAFMVGLVATADRIAQIRRNRVLTLADKELDTYVDKALIAKEIAMSRKLCEKHGWPVIDVTRRSIEETAATILRLYHDRELLQQTTDQSNEVAGS